MALTGPYATVSHIGTDIIITMHNLTATLIDQDPVIITMGIGRWSASGAGVFMFILGSLPVGTADTIVWQGLIKQ